VSRANITNLLRVLAKKNLIVQIEDHTDRRRKLLRLTEEGREMINKIEPLRKVANESMFASFTPEERVQFLMFVERTVHYLAESPPKRQNP
jgi:DNA-binding MarR family transcriptional regulator